MKVWTHLSIAFPRFGYTSPDFACEGIAIALVLVAIKFVRKIGAITLSVAHEIFRYASPFVTLKLIWKILESSWIIVGRLSTTKAFIQPSFCIHIEHSFSMLMSYDNSIIRLVYTSSRYLIASNKLIEKESKHDLDKAYNWESIGYLFLFPCESQSWRRSMCIEI